MTSKFNFWYILMLLDFVETWNSFL